MYYLFLYLFIHTWDISFPESKLQIQIRLKKFTKSWCSCGKTNPQEASHETMKLAKLWSTSRGTSPEARKKKKKSPRENILAKPVKSPVKPYRIVIKPIDSPETPLRILGKPARSLAKLGDSLAKPYWIFAKLARSLAKPGDSLVKPYRILKKPAGSLRKISKKSRQTKRQSRETI